MPRGDKSKYTDKQKRQAKHIEKGYRESGVGKNEAEARAWATVNKTTGGGRMPGGSGRAKPARTGGRTRTFAQRSEAAKKGWITRRRRAKRR